MSEQVRKMVTAIHTRAQQSFLDGYWRQLEDQFSKGDLATIQEASNMGYLNVLRHYDLDDYLLISVTAKGRGAFLLPHPTLKPSTEPLLYLRLIQWLRAKLWP